LIGFHPPLTNDLMQHLPDTSRSGKEWGIKRRLRELFNTTLYQQLLTIIQVYREGGRVVPCGDGKTWRIVPVLSMWVTDRQEYEYINQVPPHFCFHCVEEPDGTRRVRTDNDTKSQVLNDIRPGNTPVQDNCNLPLLEIDTHTSQLKVVSRAHYSGYQGP
jgi:hypothetical protein